MANQLLNNDPFFGLSEDEQLRKANQDVESLIEFLNPERRLKELVTELTAKPQLQAPLLPQVVAPRKTVRSQKPFDFFGTLFSTPQTRGLNPMELLNSTV